MRNMRGAARVCVLLAVVVGQSLASESDGSGADDDEGVHYSLEVAESVVEGFQSSSPTLRIKTGKEGDDTVSPIYVQFSSDQQNWTPAEKLFDASSHGHVHTKTFSNETAANATHVKLINNNTDAPYGFEWVQFNNMVIMSRSEAQLDENSSMLLNGTLGNNIQGDEHCGSPFYIDNGGCYPTKVIEIARVSTVVLSTIADKPIDNVCGGEDWIEVKNIGQASLNISGYKLRDEKESSLGKIFTFGNDATIDAWDTLRTCGKDESDPAKLSYTLKNDDIVSLYDDEMRLLDRFELNHNKNNFVYYNYIYEGKWSVEGFAATSTFVSTTVTSTTYTGSTTLTTSTSTATLTTTSATATTVTSTITTTSATTTTITSTSTAVATTTTITTTTVNTTTVTTIAASTTGTTTTASIICDPLTQYPCTQNGVFDKCINKDWLCDGTTDCIGGIDESTETCENTTAVATTTTVEITTANTTTSVAPSSTGPAPTGVMNLTQFCAAYGAVEQPDDDGYESYDDDMIGYFDQDDGKCRIIACNGTCASDIETVDTSAVTDFEGIFYKLDASAVINVSLWNVGGGTTFEQMFFKATAFNSDVSNWNVGGGGDFSFMFYGATAFNSDVSSWNVGSGTTFWAMFEFATAFNSDVSDWNVGSGTSFSAMFYGATAFNSDVSSWDVSSGTGFSNMFEFATAFNSDVSSWNVGNGTYFYAMFRGATAFNSDVSSWNVGSGTYFNSMFYDATAFNSNVSGWNVGSGTAFQSMFRDATAFNSDVSSWNVSSGTAFEAMFKGATAFTSDLSKWDISSVADNSATDMFKGATALNATFHNNPSYKPCWAVYDVANQEWKVDYTKRACNAPTTTVTSTSATSTTTTTVHNVCADGGMALTAELYFANVGNPSAFANVTCVADDAFKKDSEYMNFTKLNISSDDCHIVLEDLDSVKYIGERAFRSCECTVTVRGSFASLTDIREYAFVDGQSGSSIILDSSDVPALEIVGSHSFFDLYGFVNMTGTFHKLQKVDYSAFRYSRGYIDIRGGNALTIIQNQAFEDFNGIVSFTGQYPLLTDIGNYAFKDADTDGSTVDLECRGPTLDVGTNAFAGFAENGSRIAVNSSSACTTTTTTSSTSTTTSSTSSTVATSDGTTLSVLAFCNDHGDSTDAIEDDNAGDDFVPTMEFNATDMCYIHNCGEPCLRDIQLVDTGAVTNFISVFKASKVVAPNIASWDVSSGADFSSMFYSAKEFKADVGNWDVSSGKNFRYMFYDAAAFNVELGGWDVSSGTDFYGMFSNAQSFSSDLSNWDVSSGTTFAYMFDDASSFSSDLSNWDISNAESEDSVSSMFGNAHALNASFHATPAHVPCWADYDDDSETWVANFTKRACNMVEEPAKTKTKTGVYVGVGVASAVGLLGAGAALSAYGLLPSMKGILLGSFVDRGGVPLTYERLIQMEEFTPSYHGTKY